MTKSSDAGSLPFFGDAERFLSGAMCFRRCSEEGSSEYFERIVVKGFIDKIEAGIDVPSYPQFRDMNKMFLAMIDGVEKIKEGHIETNRLYLKADRKQIPEMAVIKENSQRIYGRTGRTFKAKVCITGPYTLSSLFVYRDKGIFRRLGEVAAKIVENSVFDERHGGVELVTIDEPIFGLQDDPLIDYGSEGRENLREAWESIFYKVHSKGARGCLHLHNTADDLFWGVDSLDVIESHMDNPIYEMKKTEEQLESADKFLKASLCIMNFDRLIENRIVTTSKQVVSESAINQEIAEIWRRINDGKVDPAIFVDNVELMEKRLIRLVDRFGVERIPYAGPECGLKGFPSYDCALECLRRVSGAVSKR
jgi:5-methyltetrahydropteroyltriglutamate--homocysteine methyltransferase